MYENIITLGHLENNKIISSNTRYNIENVISHITDTTVLVLNNAYSIDTLIRNKEYFRYFINEKYNFEN